MPGQMRRPDSGRPRRDGADPKGARERHIFIQALSHALDLFLLIAEYRADVRNDPVEKSRLPKDVSTSLPYATLKLDGPRSGLLESDWDSEIALVEVCDVI